MWLHESESNSLIRQACKNKIFLTIIYISYNITLLHSLYEIMNMCLLSHNQLPVDKDCVFSGNFSCLQIVAKSFSL